jgi:hypothetical protein
MPKRPPKPTPRPMLQGRTDASAFGPRIRTAQQPGQPTATMTRGMAAILPGVGTIMGAAMMKRGKRQERGR